MVISKNAILIDPKTQRSAKLVFQQTRAHIDEQAGTYTYEIEVSELQGSELVKHGNTLTATYPLGAWEQLFGALTYLQMQGMKNTLMLQQLGSRADLYWGLGVEDLEIYVTADENV